MNLNYKICPCCKYHPVEPSGYCSDCESQVYELHHAADLLAIADTLRHMSPVDWEQIRAQLVELELI